MANKRVILFAGVVGSSLGVGCMNTKLASGTGTPTGSGTPGGSPTPGGVSFCSTGGGSLSGVSGTLDCLNFAIVGDTRPATEGDTSAYPTPIITKIYQDLAADSPADRFVVGTGDYVFADPSTTEAADQDALYQKAEANYTGGPIYLGMGNHECDGYTADNCGSGNPSAQSPDPNNYTQFLSTMLPAGVTTPYYVLNVNASNGSWTAKFVFIAANAWGPTQSAWLSTTMAQPTTYTFVVRHEDIDASTAPGVTPSQNIIAGFPYTFLLEGHTHELKLYSSTRELINGIGGAPFDSGDNYGYVKVTQRSDNNMDFTAYDYMSHATLMHFVITPAGVMTN